jgi:hypothetical protein
VENSGSAVVVETAKVVTVVEIVETASCVTVVVTTTVTADGLTLKITVLTWLVTREAPVVSGA